MQTEAVPNETSSEAKAAASGSSQDPVLLGVSLPLSVTVAAANQVKGAWKDAITAILAAAKEKANAKRAAIAKKTNGASKGETSGINA